MILSLIAAVSENNVIGKNNWLPWNLPDELQYFRTTTLGKPVIMGRKTYETLKRPMPGRHNIIVSRDAALTVPGCDTVTSVEDAIGVVKRDAVDEAFVIGGSEIYRLALPLADRLYFTRVHTVIDGGDTFFPPVDWSQWKEVKSVHHPVDDRHPYAFTMKVLERK